MVQNAQGRVIPNAPAGVATIDSQQEELGVGPDKKTTLGITVKFTTAKGVQSSVFLPKAQYNPDNVRAAVAAHAVQLDQVQGMSV